MSRESTSQENKEIASQERKVKPDGVATAIYIKGINSSTHRQDLQDVFSKYGKIYDIHIPRDYYSGRNRGFAYVTYENSADAELAMNKIEYLEMGGRQITVEWAKGVRKSADQMRRLEREKSPPRRYQRYGRSPPRYGRRSPRRDSRSPPRRDSRSPVRHYSRSPPRRDSRSPVRRYSKSPKRDSRSPPRRDSRSPPRRRYSRSPVRRYSRSPVRRDSRSPPRKH